ncbi:MAG: LacI family DNA-binding transcriptional regulator [Clostridiaceae bacterium]
MSVTIKDVAREADVSPSTVSRVIANNSKISDETKERVNKAIKKLDYYPNVIARSLANNSTKILGLVLPNSAENSFENPFFIQAMAGISIYAQRKGYNIMYSFGKDDEDELSLVKKYTNSKLVDGIILLVSKSKDSCINYLKESKFNFVVVGRPENENNVLWVDNDNFDAMRKAVNIVINKGYKSFAYIGGPKHWTVSKDRLAGFKQALIDNNIPIEEDIIIEQKEFNEAMGYEAMKKILLSKTPEAVITTDDLLAFGALRMIRKEKLKNIGLVGFNNTPLSIYQNPSLSSVDINSEKLGYRAAKLLINSIEKEENRVNHYIVDTKLMERTSTKRK